MLPGISDGGIEAITLGDAWIGGGMDALYKGGVYPPAGPLRARCLRVKSKLACMNLAWSMVRRKLPGPSTYGRGAER